MRERFIRVLFGREDFALRKGIINDLDTAVNSPVRLNEIWYCYGVNNFCELSKRGIKDIVLMDNDSLSTFGSQGERNPQHFDTINYGSNFFRHRYPAIEKALESYEAVVMLDLDTVAVKPVPEDFWQRAGNGAEFRCVLRAGRRPYCGWRSKGKHFVPCGSLQYWRRGEAIHNMNEMYAENPSWWDPVTLGRMTDWISYWDGPENYKAKGMEFPMHVITEGHQWFPCEETIFRSGRKKGLRSLAKGGLI